ncbi:MAG: AbiH family protein [Candidatus Limiplasma sp.]|nr:AbiH family protein [Candidatus Limiplasma sp.]
MKTVILVGNGFDLNMGLPTRYSDFLKYYQKISSPDASIRRLKRTFFRFIGPRSENWADLEETLGKFTARFPDSLSGLNDFFKLHADILSQISRYLENQVSNIHYPSACSSICDAFSSLPNMYLSHLNDISRSILNNTLALDPQHQNTYTFASFNYTKVLDMCVQMFLNNTHSASQNWTLTPEVFHIHGYSNLHPILGVDKLTQINNHFQNTSDLARGFIKETTLSRCGIDVNTLIQILQESHIVLLYGLSLGVTDASWWEYLVNWLVKDKDHQLIIYTRCDGNADINPRIYITSVDSILSTMANYLPDTIDQKRKEVVLSQIHVIVNRNLFPFRLV